MLKKDTLLLKSKLPKTFILVLIINLTSSFSNAQGEWKTALEKDAIRVYTREMADSKFKEYKGETLVKTTLSCLVSLLDDAPYQKNWMYDITEAKRLKTINKTEGYNYFVQTAPWPVTDRDVIIKYTLTQDKKTKAVTIELKGVKDYIAEKQDKVRIPSLKGKWEFIPLGNGIIKVVYQVHSETGGYVPASIANAVCVDIPYNTLKNLKKEIENPKYRNAVIDELLEP